MSKKTAAAIIAVVLALVAVHNFRRAYPEITWPVITSSLSEPESPSSNGSPYKFYYDNLTVTEKQAYNMILDKIYDMPDKILVPDLNEEELDNVFSALLSDNPDLFFLGRKCSVKAELWNDFFSVDYIIEKEDYEKQKAELDAACDKVIASLTNRNSQYQTELEIHNYIIDHCSYKIEKKNFVYSSAYGCLVNGVAACEGYSKAAKLLFDRVGIESALISGTATTSKEAGGAHMWNIVNIDGSYYHLDCTWDDPVTPGKNMRLYTYFNLSDEAIGKTHFNFSIDPGCVSTGANYYEKNSLTFPNYSSADNSKLKETIINQYKAGERQIQINFANEKSYKSAISSLIDKSGIYNVLKSAKINGKTVWDKFEGYYDNKDTYTLTLVFK